MDKKKVQRMELRKDQDSAEILPFHQASPTASRNEMRLVVTYNMSFQIDRAKAGEVLS